MWGYVLFSCQTKQYSQSAGVLHNTVSSTNVWVRFKDSLNVGSTLPIQQPLPIQSAVASEKGNRSTVIQDGGKIK
jgi:hypothetical protein